jgi:guanylate kinase
MTPPVFHPDPAHHFHRLPTDTDDGMLLIISGPSGVGKTTITRGVERSIADAVFSVSWTTRDRTGVDVEGVDYHFVNDAEFERQKAANGFLETAGVYGRKYGTPKEWVFTQLDRGRLVILEIDVQGAIDVKKQVKDAFAIFIEPPNETELLARLRTRKREDEAGIQKRFGKAKDEIALAKSCGVYDIFIVNKNIDDAIERAVSLVRAERARRRKQ